MWSGTRESGSLPRPPHVCSLTCSLTRGWAGVACPRPCFSDEGLFVSLPPPRTQRSAPARRGNAAAVINRTIRSVGASAVDLLADTADLWPIMPLYRWAELPGVCHAGLFVEMGDGQRRFWGGGGGFFPWISASKFRWLLGFLRNRRHYKKKKLNHKQKKQKLV